MNINAKLAIIIANYNGYHDTLECLESLKNSVSKDFFVVLVDDCSTEKDSDLLSNLEVKEFPVIYKKTPYNMGFAGANNMGIREALQYAPEFVLLLNNDTIVKQDTLELLLKTSDHNTIAAPKILYHSEPSKIWAIGMVQDEKLKLCRNGHAMEEDIYQGNEVISCDGVSFCCCMMPADIFSKVGYLDETFYMYHEDVDYCFRAKKTGYRFVCNTAAVIYHKDGGTGVGASKKGFYLGLRNECYIREKYFKGGWKYNGQLWITTLIKQKVKLLFGIEHGHQDEVIAAINAWRSQEKGRCFNHFQTIDVYVCHTSYHVLITIIKALKSNNPVRVVLCTGNTLPDSVIDRIRNSGIFDQVYIDKELDEYNRELDYSGFFLLRHRKLQKQLDRRVAWSHLKNYEYYLFNDISIIGKWLNSHRIYYNLLEDACDTYKQKAFQSFYYKESQLRRFIKCRLGISFYCFGASCYTKSIEVNSLDNILLKSPKLKVMSKAELFQSVTEEEKKKIINVFLTSQEQEEIQHKLQNISGQKMSLLLTQPWYDDKVMSEYMHREFYKHIIDKYVKYPIIIKPHPRDKQNYECLYPDAIVLKQTYVPCEILGFISNIEVEQAVTHCSTAIHGITYAKEKIFLGVDYMVPFLKRDTDFVQTSLLAKELMADNDDKPEME